MKKMNKKGFTLIEMLVVIAIIAVLVSIIIPVVSSSTVKARAAADAANLRSVLSECTIAYTADNTVVKTASDFPDVVCESGDYDLSITQDSTTKEFTVKFGNYDIADFANCAEDGTLEDTH